MEKLIASENGDNLKKINSAKDKFLPENKKKIKKIKRISRYR